MATAAPAITLAFQSGGKRNRKEKVKRAFQLSQPLSKCAFLEASPPCCWTKFRYVSGRAGKCQPYPNQGPFLREKRIMGIGKAASGVCQRSGGKTRSRDVARSCGQHLRL